jgi:hypothetical protein
MTTAISLGVIKARHFALFAKKEKPNSPCPP